MRRAVLRPLQLATTLVSLAGCCQGLARQEGGAKVEGVVVQRPAGQPVAGAVVTLSGPAAVLTSVTEAGGSFRFEAAPAGEYLVQVQKRGMFLAGLGGDRSPKRIRVRPGVAVHGLRYELIEQAVIAGKVLNEAGEPVQGARVCALRRVLSESGPRIIENGADVTTDDRGEFRLAGLRPGWYLISATAAVVAARADGTRTAIHIPVFYGGALDPEAAQQLQVAAGQEVSGLEIRLPAVPARRLSGRVVSGDGSPAQRFQLIPRPVLPGGLYGAYGAVRRLEDGSGRFEVRDLPPGRYLVAAESRAAGPAATGQALIGTAEADLRSADAEGLEIRLGPAPVLRGKVAFEGTAAAGGAAFLAQGAVQAFPVAGPPGVATGPVQADGSFEVSLPAPGRYQLRLTGPFLARAYIAGIRTPAGSSNLLEVNVRDGSEFVQVLLRTDGARLTLYRPESDRDCVTVNAVLMDPDGKLGQPPFAQVRLKREYPGVLAAVPPGDYRLAAYCTEEDLDETDGGLFDWLFRQAATVRLAPGEEREAVVKVLRLPGY